jgi:uncharacterized protein
MVELFAFDRSMRRYDADGRLHVEVTRISKATVNPYYGREIPGGDELGLEPDRVYHLLRDPAELAAAASSFNNLPILGRHIPVSAHGEDTHAPADVIGSTGTDAAFDDPYLVNSAVIWAGPAVAGVESREQQEWSCAYRYAPDMTPGTYQGLHYDGIMRNIVGNHVALVEAGRAGSDVVVGDSQFEGHMAIKTRSALMLSGALTALITPRLAEGMAFDASPFVQGVTRKNFARKTADLGARLVRQYGSKMAADEGLDVDDVIKVIGAVQGEIAQAEEPDAIPDPTPAVDDDGDAVSKILAYLKGKLSDEDLAEVSAMAGGEAPALDGMDEPDEDDKPAFPPKDDTPAMDAATIRAETIREMNAIADAKKAVFPHVGEVAAMDSAEAIYRFALDAAKVDLTGVHPSAFKAMVGMLPGKVAAPAPRLGMDEAARESFAKRFPTARPLKIA